MDTRDLTRRQRQIYQYLVAHADQLTQPPTLDELCARLTLRSRGSLHKHIQALVAAGLVEPMQGKHRGVRLRRRTRERELPLLGYIAAGRPIEAVTERQDVEVPAALRSDRPCYVLEVRGDSMIEEGILDGDLVVVEHRDQARNGDLVVALIDGSEATLKRIVQSPDEVELWPANSRLQAQRYRPDRVQVQGVVVGQMRSYR